MLKLGVNIDHVATLRQARYRSAQPRKGDPSKLFGAIPEPNPWLMAGIAETAGAHSITVHLREDRRHIQDDDVRWLRKTIHTRLNLEMADIPEIVDFAEQVRPDEICLVPEKREEVTTEGGLNIVAAAESLTGTVKRLKKAGISVSIFIDPSAEQIRAAWEVGVDFVELHTGTYANATNESEAATEIKRLMMAAELAHKFGLRVNAGHGLNYKNTPGILAVPHLETLNTGHAIIAHALFVGLPQAVRDMLALMNPREP